MNLIAEQALLRARARMAETPAYQPVALGVPEPVAEAPAVVELAIDPVAQVAQAAPFSRLLFLEGRRHAIGIVQSVRGLLQTEEGAREVLASLRRAAAERPHSYAKGITEIADLLQNNIAALPGEAL